MNYDLRVGIGHDTHRTTPDRKLLIGGVEISFELGLAGHSDADVLLHAVTDAVLGAAALGDIGELYPDKDPANLNRDSGEMLVEAMGRVRAAGWEVVNLDCIVFAQRPKLSAYKREIASRIAELIGLDPTCVGVKAKTAEGLGSVGRGEAMQAQCVALLARRT